MQTRPEFACSYCESLQTRSCQLPTGTDDPVFRVYCDWCNRYSYQTQDEAAVLVSSHAATEDHYLVTLITSLVSRVSE